MRKLSFLMAVLLIPSLAFAEDVEPRTKLPSDRARIRGAASLMNVPWGFVAYGGSALRQLPTGASQWETLYRVPGDNLYRMAADDKGRLLAAWENDNDFHLFIPKTHSHQAFPKPPKLGPEFRTWSLDDLHFAKDGNVILYMNGMTGSCTWTTVAYYCRLDGKGKPKMLFRQEGHELQSGNRLAAFAYSEDHSRGCDYNACFPLNGLYAYVIEGDHAIRRPLLETKEPTYSIARLVWGSDDERLAIVVYDRKNVRHLLRWRPGQGPPDMRPLPEGPGYDVVRMWMTRTDDVIEAWQTDDYQGLLLRRFSPGGKMTEVHLGPRNRKVYWDSSVYTMKERANGDLFLQWGRQLVLFPKGQEPRTLDLDSLLKRKNEWAGAVIYVKEPEALWLGVEVGGGRDFIYLGFDEIEKKTKPRK